MKIESYCNVCGSTDVNQHVSVPPQNKPEQEMVQDLLTIVHYFSRRLYGLRISGGHMSPWIIYSLVPIFFLGLFVVIAIIMQEPQQEHQDTSNAAVVTRSPAVSYGMLAIFFAFIVVLTVLTQKKQS
jgi:hypothetical protein